MPQGRKGESNGIDEEGDGIDDVRGKNEGGKEDEDEDKKKKKKKKKGKWMCRKRASHMELREENETGFFYPRA
ncbi:hypothetical protein PV326_005779 [Microctonus aethiopoides]|nr:hypothetical protein PV326_005779 [Microctonus aethiopoides]